MKSVVYSPYLDSLGGGERYMMTIAELLGEKGEVDIVWPDASIQQQIEQRFNLHLHNTQFIDSITQKNLLKRFKQLRKYDVCVYLSDGSFPLGHAKKNILHLQIPFEFSQAKTVKNKLKLATWQHVICNSQFTKARIDASFGINSEVIYPPVDVSTFQVGKKENIILNVGRFYGIEHGKKQEFLIDTFKKSVDNGLKSWQLFLAGSIENQQFYNQLQERAKGYPIAFYGNISFNDLVGVYARSSIYWHAQGYKETEAKYQEHFGITTVEAMASGCVPVVIGLGGQREIVDDGVDGFLWQTEDELVKKTTQLIDNADLRNNISYKAKEKSMQFSKETFRKQVETLL